LERRKLEANSRWDVGTIRLAAGGDVRIVVVDGEVEGSWFSIQDDQQKWYGGLDVQRGQATSEQLPVGGYRLFASGKTKAAQAIPFTIRAGETTRVEVRVRAGVRQRFDLALPEKVEKASLTVRILRGAEVVANTWASRQEGKPCTAEACLDAGDYTVTATSSELHGSAAFTVGEREGDPVRIAVQQK
jgi:hypothetical protein